MKMYFKNYKLNSAVDRQIERGIITHMAVAPPVAMVTLWFLDEQRSADGEETERDRVREDWQMISRKENDS